MTNRVAVKLLTAPATNLAAKMPFHWVLKQFNGPKWVGEFALHSLPEYGSND